MSSLVGVFGGVFGDEDDRQASGAPAGIVVERGPLVEDKIFVDTDELHVIGQHLRDAYSTLGEAVSVYRDLDRAGGQYCDEGTFAELDSLTLDALGAIEHAWEAVCVVTDAHEAQLREADDAGLHDDDDDEHEGQDGDTPGGDGGPVPPVGL